MHIANALCERPGHANRYTIARATAVSIERDMGKNEATARLQSCIAQTL